MRFHSIGAVCGAVAVALGVSGGAFAQISLSSAASTYLQNFDTLASTGTTSPFTNNGTILGLYAKQFNGTAATGTPATYQVNIGSSTTGALYSFGAAGSTERAFGSIASGTTGGLAYGFRFVNSDPSAKLTGFTINYTGEQWRNGGNTAAQSLIFSYAVFNSGVGDIGNDAGTTPVNFVIDSRYTRVGLLDFTSPTVGATAAALNGNDPANQQGVSGTVNSLNLVSNQELWVRFIDLNDAGNDHGLAVDNLSLTGIFSSAAATPEPGTLALFVVGAAPFAARLMRRRTNSSCKA